MAQPPAYNRTKDFTADFGNETDHSAVNAELDGAANSINDIRYNLALLQADDGLLRPEVVTADSLSDALREALVAEVEEDAAYMLGQANSASLAAVAAAATATTKAGEAATSAAAADASATASADSATASAASVGALTTSLAASAGASLVGASDGRTLQANLDAPVFSNNAKGTKEGAIFTEYHNTNFGNGNVKVAVGMLGNPEANLSINMDYTTGVHKYYDSTRAAMWMAMGPDNFAMQHAATGAAPELDCWDATGNKYLWGGFSDGRFFFNSFLGDNVGTAQVYVRRNVGVASIGGDGDLVLEGSRIFGQSAPVLVNAYNAGNVVLASGGGKVSIGTLTALNDCEIATTSSDGSSGVDGVCISDGETTGRMSLNFGVHTGGMYAWLQASKSGSGLKDLKIQPSGGDTYFGGGGIYPLTDNTKMLGGASFRWSTIYAGTGTINTSDARDKTAVASFSDAEISAAKDLSSGIGIYQFLESVQAKGDKARRHIGMTVQRAIEIMESHGLDPFGYGFICYDEWDEKSETVQINVGQKVKVKREIQRQVTKPRTVNEYEIEIIDGKPVRKSVARVVDEPVFAQVEVVDEAGKAIILHRPAVAAKPAVPAEVDADGQLIKLATPATEAIPASSKPMTHPVPVMETVTEEVEVDAEPVYETRLVRAAGDKYAFRYDQLNLFIARGIEARLTEIEA